ncbi:MAG TPA: hypothetical protein VLX59_05045 [Acidimicrobiales bacterium]|nr:hypothetical protein [Acidimicrobiales bacterium]
MALYIVRVWVPDRPGALGAVASRIGAVRGDLVGIDILERGAGRAIDELVVDLPSESLVKLLISEVSQVDGVDVEDVRRASDALADPRLDALETAANLVSQSTIGPLLKSLARSSVRDFQSDWASIVEPDLPEHVVLVGPAPPGEWLQAFLAGSRASVAPRPGEVAPDDVAWADMDAAGLVLILGRQGRPFRVRERRQLTALARIVDSRWAELTARAGRMVHPSASL